MGSVWFVIATRKAKWEDEKCEKERKLESGSRVFVIELGVKVDWLAWDDIRKSLCHTRGCLSRVDYLGGGMTIVVSSKEVFESCGVVLASSMDMEGCIVLEGTPSVVCIYVEEMASCVLVVFVCSSWWEWVIEGNDDMTSHVFVVLKRKLGTIKLEFMGLRWMKKGR